MGATAGEKIPFWLPPGITPIARECPKTLPDFGPQSQPGSGLFRIVGNEIDGLMKLSAP